MTGQELAELVDRGHETSGVEFKGPGPRSDRRLFAQVTRAVLGMANRRNGGRVIIGVEDNGSVLSLAGLNDQDFATWQYDAVADGLATYADPSVNFEREVTEYDGAWYVVL